MPVLNTMLYMRRRAWSRVFAAALLSAAAAQTAEAQELFGTLRDVNAQPVVGAVVLVLQVNDSSIVARALTGARGTYRVAGSTDSVFVRVLRIGLQPETIGQLKLAPGERRELSALLQAIAVSIASIDTRVESRCRVRPGGASAVAQLFAQARTALIASRLQAAEGSPRSHYEVRVARLDSRDRPMEEAQNAYHTRTTFRPFESVSLDVLVDEGYRTTDPDGMMTYRAPDADIVTSDAFLTDYCLSLVQGDGEHPAWIGVGFEPARQRRNIVQVRGILWIDRASSELRQLEYSYLGLEPILRRAKPGGYVAYTRLANGVWFVHEWAIRMPIVNSAPGTNVSRRGALSYARVSGTQITSGQVLEVLEDDVLRYTAGEYVPTSTGAALIASLVALGELSVCSRDSDSTHSTLTGVVRDTAGNPIATAVVRAVWTPVLRSAQGTGGKMVATESRDLVTRTGTDGTFGLCGVPRGVVISVGAELEGRTLASTALRIRRDNATAAIELRAGPER